MRFEKIKLDDANFTQMKQFAELELGIDIPKNTSTDQLRDMIKQKFGGGDIMAVVGSDPAAESTARPAPAAIPTEVPVGARSAAAPASPEPSAPVSAAAALPVGADPYDTLTVTVQVHETEEGGGNSSAGKEPVFVSVNGRAIWIERNKPQTIKMKYFEVLRHAEKLVYTYNDKTDEITSRRIPAYPFQVLSEVPRIDNRAA